MASSVRSRRPSTVPELDPDDLNNVERLIFAQAVYEFGTRSWAEVAKLLSNHPLIAQSKSAFTIQSCPVLHRRFMEDAKIEWSEADVGPRSEKHLKLAQRYYVERVKELRELIAVEEVNFKRLVTEIDEIRSGAWDVKIRASLGLESPEDTQAQDIEARIIQPETAEPEESAEEASGPVEPAATKEEPEAAPEPLPVQEEEEEEQDVEEPKTLPEVEEQAGGMSFAPKYRTDARLQPEEGSDNEAVNELVGNFSSEKPIEGAQEEEDAAAPEDPPPEVEEDEMEVEADETAEPEDVAGTPQPSGPVSEDASQEPESPEVPISMAQEAAFSRSAGKRKASDADTLMLDAREPKRAREDSEPLDEDDGGPKTRRKERSSGADAPVVSKRFQNVIGMLHSQISQHRYGNIFHNPIKKSEAPDYHDIVKRPMDLKTIKSRVKDGLISNSLEFQRDIYLMFANAMMYNRPGSEIYNMAEEMMVFSAREINAFRQTEGFHRM
ncbi:hypothetical protein C2E23DRAFT_821573 [Lenzites betulinus]|nr:hypothetical protein C2E23DRAFT_821573 [Lenzites betulinus]